MNWSQLFYYYTIADNLHVVLVILSTIAATLAIIALGLYFNCYMSEDYGNARKFKIRSVAGLSSILSLLVSYFGCT